MRTMWVRYEPYLFALFLYRRATNRLSSQSSCRRRLVASDGGALELERFSVSHILHCLQSSICACGWFGVGREQPGDEEMLHGYGEGNEGENATGGVGHEDMSRESLQERLKEIEDETYQLQQMKQNIQSSGTEEPESNTQESREEADTRSIFVSSVDYSTTAEELQAHFSSCGTVNRVTILRDKTGHPKGVAYIEFLEVDAVRHALLLHGTEINGRKIKVFEKRTNQPGYKKRGAGRRGRGGRNLPPQAMDPYFLAMMASQMYGPAAGATPPSAGGRGRARGPPRGRGGRGRGAPPSSVAPY